MTLQRLARAREVVQPRHERRHVRVAALVVAFAVVTQSAVSVYLTRDGWFTLDSWHYLMTRGGVPTANVGVWEPVGGHWQTTIILLYRVLFALFGMHSFLPYIAVNIGLHAVVTGLVYCLVRRTGVSAPVSATVGVIIAMLGAGSEVFLWDGPVPLIAALALGLGALLTLVTRGFSRESVVWASLLLLLAVMTSGVGAVVLSVVAVFCLAERGWRTAVRVVAPPLIALAGWFVLIGRTAGRVDTASRDYLQWPEYIWTGLTGALQQATGVPALGAATAVAIFLTPLVAPTPSSRLRSLAWAGNFGAVVQLALSGSAGLVFGVEQGTQSRYAYIVLVLLAPSLAMIGGWLAGFAVATSRRVLLGFLVVALGLYAVNALKIENEQASRAAAFGSIAKDWALGITAAHKSGERILTPGSTGLAADMDSRLVLAPGIQRALPHEAPTPRARIVAESEFFVGVGPETYDLFAPVDGTFTKGFDTPLVNEAGCRTYRAGSAPELVIETHDGIEIGVTGPGGPVTTELSRNGLRGNTRTWFQKELSLHIATTAKEAQLRVGFSQPGDYTFCTH